MCTRHDLYDTAIANHEFAKCGTTRLRSCAGSMDQARRSSMDVFRTVEAAKRAIEVFIAEFYIAKGTSDHCPAGIDDKRHPFYEHGLAA
jgi:hypothetical protein